MEETGFKKINFEPVGETKSVSKPPEPFRSTRLQTNMKSKRFPKINKKVLAIVAVVLGLIVLVGVYSSVMAFGIYKQAKKVEAQARLAAAAAKQQNIVDAKDQLVKTKAEAVKLDQDIKSIGFLRYVPFFGGYVSDADHMVSAGIHGINAGIITADSLIPYADVLGLKGQGSFVGGSAEERIRTAITSMSKVTPKIDDIEKEVTAAQKDMDQVSINRYPNFGPFKKVRGQITTVKNLVDGGALAVQQGKPLIKVLPELLGADKAKKYLVIFQNDKELRPTGGFLTFYSIFRIEQGVIHIDSSSDIYKLDDSISYHPTADPIILKYLPKVPTQNIRDINLSPDFQKSMDDFRSYYAKSSQKTDVDGIIAIDTQFLVDIIRILGGVDADGQHFTADIDPACNCPQVVYQLEQNTTKPVGYVRENRKAIVGDLLYATMQKALGVSPKIYWGPLFQSAIKNASEKHVLFSLNNKDAQSGIEALNWAGQIKPFDGDYLHINDANFGGAKSNMYVQQAVKMEYNVASSGEITKTVTINYKNPEKYSDCNLESGGLCLNAILRDFQRVYVPKGSQLISSKGSQVKVETKQDLGKTYFESFFTVNPLGIASMTYTYKLPFKVTNGVLPVLIQKQPGVENIPFEVYVNGRKTDAFDLRADKTFNLKI
ncbi:MAG TPA: DUF4012 domain-containing protein [Patescibacteria group bacterium]|nr:DUF4012 domain-containing protein [Patescibacteria group bacterium]